MKNISLTTKNRMNAFKNWFAMAKEKNTTVSPFVAYLLNEQEKERAISKRFLKMVNFPKCLRKEALKTLGK